MFVYNWDIYFSYKKKFILINLTAIFPGKISCNLKLMSAVIFHFFDKCFLFHVKVLKESLVPLQITKKNQKDSFFGDVLPDQV